MRLTLLLLLASSCGPAVPARTEPTTESTAAVPASAMTTPAPTAAPRAPATDAPHLVLLSHGGERPTARVEAVTLGGSLVLHGGVDIDAEPNRDWPGHYEPVAAAHEGETWVHAEAAPSGYVLFVHDLSGRAVRGPIPLGVERPAALFLHRGVLFVGFANQVGWLDLGSPSPALTIAVRREAFGKRYDLFVGAGERVLAIDDEVTPFYADWFAVRDLGAPERLADLTLPSAVNGTYRAADLVAVAEGFDVYAVISFETLMGEGQSLVRLPLRGDTMSPLGGEVVNGMHHLPVMTERAPEEDTTAVPSDPPYTGWSGIAALPASGRVFLAAGSRGLLSAPLEFTGDAALLSHPFEGSAVDVVRVGEQLIVLVDDPAPALVVLTWNGALREVARHPLPQVYQHIVR